MNFSLFAILAVFASVQIVVSLKNGCLAENECQEHECCRSPIWVGKRGLNDSFPLRGFCEAYTREGEDCVYGPNQCGCQKGTVCKKVADAKPSLAKLVVLMPPGVFKCVRQ